MAKQELHTDPLGLAYESYYNGNEDAFFTLYSSQFEPDDIAVSHFYRAYKDMPVLEQKAIELSRGKVLDVGAGSGVHSLVLQEKGFDVTAVEISPLAADILRKRNVQKVICDDYFNLTKQTYDTLLFLMNGIGLIQTIDGFANFFKHTASLLNKGGQILLDSSDLRYLFEEEDGSFLIPISGNYYGEIDFKVGFENYISEEFSWVYVDPETLYEAAKLSGFSCEIIQEGEHYDYLAQLTKL